MPEPGTGTGRARDEQRQGQGVSDEQLSEWFTHRDQAPGDRQKYAAVRDAALAFARVIRNNCHGDDQLRAIHKVREAMATAHDGIGGGVGL